MKNTYSKDFEGNNVLTLNYDGSMEVEVTVESKQIFMFKSDRHDSQLIMLDLEDWEEFKTFVDSQIEGV